MKDVQDVINFLLENNLDLIPEYQTAKTDEREKRPTHETKFGIYT